ncbi:hypothetical protein PV721_33460 [Streptomyces sp. MB09-01]|nr:hypothetical protein [Streptomyces sp. MB09-01]
MGGFNLYKGTAPPLAPGTAGSQAYLEALPPDTLLVNVHCRG